MPWLLAGVLSYVGYAVAVKKGWVNSIFPTAPTVIPVSIDPYMPPNLESAVVAQITGSDPNQLMTTANQIVTYFPAAAYSLQHRAWQLLGGAMSGQPEPQPPAPAQQQSAFVAWRAAQSLLAAGPTPPVVAPPQAPAPAPVPAPVSAPAPAPVVASPPAAPPVSVSASVNGAASASPA